MAPWSAWQIHTTSRIAWKHSKQLPTLHHRDWQSSFKTQHATTRVRNNQASSALQNREPPFPHRMIGRSGLDFGCRKLLCLTAVNLTFSPGSRTDDFADPNAQRTSFVTSQQIFGDLLMWDFQWWPQLGHVPSHIVISVPLTNSNIQSAQSLREILLIWVSHASQFSPYARPRTLHGI